MRVERRGWKGEGGEEWRGGGSAGGQKEGVRVWEILNHYKKELKHCLPTLRNNINHGDVLRF